MFDKNVMSSIPKDGIKKYFLIDCGAYLMPYLKYHLHTFNKLNITPFIKILEDYFYLSTHTRNYRFLFFIDNGVPEKIEALYSAYKKNRKHSKHRREDRIISRNVLESNEYVANRTFISQVFTMLGEGVFYCSEADYQLGYVLKKLLEDYNVDGSNCYVISHDKDLMALIGYSNCIRRLINSKEKSIKFYFYPKGDYLNYFGKDAHIYSYKEFIIHKSLTGDRGDNISAPIMVKESFVKKLFSEYKFNYGLYELDIDKTFEIILDKLVNKLIKKNDDSNNKQLIIEQLAYEFRRNHLIFDVYNSEQLFKPVDKNFMNTILDNVVQNKVKRNYQSAYDSLRRISGSYADIFAKWLTDMKSWHEKHRAS